MKLPGVKKTVMIREEASDDAYVMNTENGDMLRLNDTALMILRCCQEGHTLDEACERIAAGFSEGLEKIRPDIEKTVKTLQDLGFLEN